MISSLHPIRLQISRSICFPVNLLQFKKCHTLHIVKYGTARCLLLPFYGSRYHTIYQLLIEHNKHNQHRDGYDDHICEQQVK